MKCGDKEWQNCRVEKMGCTGCYYEKYKIPIGIKVSASFFIKLREQCLAVNRFSNKGWENTPENDFKFKGLPILIDNKIKTDYEIVYGERPNIDEFIEEMRNFLPGREKG